MNKHKPIVLKQLSSRERVAYTVCLTLAIALVVFGWLSGLRDVIKMGVTGVKEQAQAIKKAGTYISTQTASSRENVQETVKQVREEVGAAVEEVSLFDSVVTKMKEQIEKTAETP